MLSTAAERLEEGLNCTAGDGAPRRVELQACDEVTVTWLNPMHELGLSVPVMLFDVAGEMTLGIRFDSEYVAVDDYASPPAGSRLVHISQYVGWRRRVKYLNEGDRTYVDKDG